jgi:hypothetical protein
MVHGGQGCLAFVFLQKLFNINRITLLLRPYRMENGHFLVKQIRGFVYVCVYQISYCMNVWMIRHECLFFKPNNVNHQFVNFHNSLPIYCPILIICKLKYLEFRFESTLSLDHIAWNDVQLFYLFHSLTKVQISFLPINKLSKALWAVLRSNEFFQFTLNNFNVTIRPKSKLDQIIGDCFLLLEKGGIISILK